LKIFSKALSIYFAFCKRIVLTSVENTSQVEGQTRQELSARALILSLRSILRRFPFWKEGHLEFATQSLIVRDVEAAYASVQGAIQLEGNPPKPSAPIRKLLAICYVRSGDSIQSAALLEDLLVELPNDKELRSELVACCLAIGEYARVRSILEPIPSSSLSAEEQAALVFVRKGGP